MGSSSRSTARLASSSRPIRNWSGFRSQSPRSSRSRLRRLILGESREELAHWRRHLPDATPAGCKGKDVALAELDDLAGLGRCDDLALDDVHHFTLAIELTRDPAGVTLPQTTCDAAVGL